MLMCRAVEIKEGLFGEENFSLSDGGKIENYTFQQSGVLLPVSNVKEFTKTRTITVPKQPKTPLQESIEEIQEWQKENKFEKLLPQIKNSLADFIPILIPAILLAFFFIAIIFNIRITL